MLLGDLFSQAGAAVLLAALLSFLARRLGQPLIVAYIVAGVVAGPSLLGLLPTSTVLDAFSKFGVAFLLFTVGLGLNWRSVKEVGGIALATGVGQVLFTALVGYPLGLAFGLSPLASAYVAVAFAFSSTIIIIKLLLDKEEIDTLYGRISVGFLLVQDFIAMVILLGLVAVQSGGDVGSALGMTLVKAALLVPAGWFISVKVAPRVVAYAARSQELLLIFAIGWCVAVAGVLVWLGFGLELGTLVAGVMLSGTVEEKEIETRIRPLRDFFLVLFFIALGSGLHVEDIRSSVGAVAAFSAFILLGNPLIVLFIMRIFGYHPRTGFLAGTTVAQISEFSFIVLAAGVAAGHVPENLMGLAAAVGLVTIAGSAYLIEYNERIYERLRPLFRWMEPRGHHGDAPSPKNVPPHVLLFGYHRIGESVLQAILELRKKYRVVDFDPEVLRELASQGIPVTYGDVSDAEFLADIGANHVPFIVSAIPDAGISLSLLAFLRSKRSKTTAIVSARTAHEAAQCYAAGAAYVIVPNILGGEKFRELLETQGTGAKAWRLLGRKERAILEAV